MTVPASRDRTGRITQAELARRLNVSRPSVSKAVKAGRITPDEDGLFDPTEAELQWLANTRPKAQGITAKDKGQQSGYAQARARKESALARMAELRLEQATGNLVSREAVDYVLSDYAKTLQGLLENIPDRLAPSILPLRDMESIRAVIAETADEVLKELSATMEHRARELEPDKPALL